MRFEDQFESGQAIPRKVLRRRARRAKSARAKHWLTVKRTICDCRGHRNKPRTPMSAAHDRRQAAASMAELAVMAEAIERHRRRGETTPLPQLPDGLRFVSASAGTFTSGDVYRFEVQTPTLTEV